MTGSTLASKILATALTDSGYRVNSADKKLVAVLVAACEKSVKAGAKWTKKDIEDFACGGLSDQRRIARAKANGKVIDATLTEIMDSL